MVSIRGSGWLRWPPSPGSVTTLAVAATALAAALLPATSAQADAAHRTAAGGHWGSAHPLPGFAALNKSAQTGSASISELSCGSPGNCAAGGYYTDGAGHQQAFVASEVGGTWHKAIEVPGTAALNTGGWAWVRTVSCAPSDYCAAGGYYSGPGVDQQAFVITSVDGIWGTAEEVPGTAKLNLGGQASVYGMSCPSAGNCAAGGIYTDAAGYNQAFVVSEHDGTWRDARQVPGTGSGQFATEDPAIDSLSCPSAGNCGASGFAGGSDVPFVVSETNGRWHRAEFVPGLDALSASDWVAIANVSCPAAGNCGAGGLYFDDADAQYHAFVVSEVNGTWGKAREVTGFAAFHGHQPGIQGVSCGAPGNCGAVGTSQTAGFHARKQSDNQAFVLGEHDGAWGEPELVRGIPILAALKGFIEFGQISCTAPGDCSAGGTYQGRDGHSHAFVIGETDGTWGAAEQVPGVEALDRGGDAGIDVLSCAAPGHCSAAGGFFRKDSTHENMFVVSER